MDNIIGCTVSTSIILAYDYLFLYLYDDYDYNWGAAGCCILISRITPARTLARIHQSRTQSQHSLCTLSHTQPEDCFIYSMAKNKKKNVGEQQRQKNYNNSLPSFRANPQLFSNLIEGLCTESHYHDRILLDFNSQFLRTESHIKTKND